MPAAVDPRAYVVRMLRRDLGRDPTVREVRTWLDWFKRSGALAPDTGADESPPKVTTST
jgi:hypothetical protein